MIKIAFGLDKYTKAKAITFGLENPNANFTAKNIKFDKNGYATFDVYENGTFFEWPIHSSFF